jgi:protein TonB
MSTIVKDTEVPLVSPEAAAPRPAAGNVAPAEFAPKPQPVALEVSITVNGARSVDGTDKREPFSESSKTVLVFGNGAVIRLQSSVAPGQLLFLTNEKTKKEVVCQVVKSKNYRNVSGYVELEFTEPVVGFWGMRFPGDRIAPSAANGSAAAPVTPASSAPAIGAPAVPSAPAPAVSSSASALPAAALEPPKSFVPAGAEAPKPAPVKADVRASSPQLTPPVSAAPVGTTLSPAKPAPSLVTTAALDMNLLRRVSETRSIPAIPAAPSGATPAPQKPEATTPDLSKPAAADPTEALRAENARLQEQLSAFLGQNAKKSDETPSSLPGKVAEIAAVSFAKTSEAQAGEATPFIAPPAPASNPPAATKISASSLESLLDEEPVKIPAWLESLARHSAAPAESKLENEPLLASSVATAVEAQNFSAAPQLGSPVGDSHLDEDHAAAADASVTGTFEVPAPSFGSGSLFADDSASAEPAAGGKKGLLFALLAAGILLAGGGGYWYTHQGAAILGGAETPRQSASVSQRSAPDALPSASASSAPVTQPASPANSQNTRSASAGKDAAVPASLVTTLPAAAGRSAQPLAASPAPVDPQPAAAQPKKPTLGQIRLAAPKANPKSDGSAVGDADLALNNSAEPGDAALGATFASSSGPAAPSAPVTVGGDVKTAKLLKSIPPVYPAFAKTQHVSGDVKVDALIDAAGHVTTMKIVSGPAMLHQAAMDALRQWKYQPATLDGKAVPMHLTVTIQFRLQ